MDTRQMAGTRSGKEDLKKHLRAAASESREHQDTEMEVDEKLDFAAQPQAKWKPIPPLLPELQEHPRSPYAKTRNQSCQTEEQLQHGTTCSHCPNAGLCAEPGDPPLLQQPLQTSKSGIQQIIECFRSGTSQLKHILLREVDTIFECKICRSLFRGLPNLITHKEYYCLSRMPEHDGSSGDDRHSVAIKDALDAKYSRAEQSDCVVRLEPIQSTTKAVYQYLTTEEELARYPSHTTSARESPVVWEGEATEGADSNPTTLQGGQESVGSATEEEAKEEQQQPEDEGSNSGVEDVTISCCLCGQDFNSRRSIRRHCRKMHQTKLEELRKFTETRTVPTSLLSMVKGRQRTLSTPTGKSCPVCLKSFATKANTRRHFDEVHRGLRRDSITPAVALKPGQPFPVETTPPRKSSNSSPTRSHKSTPVSSKSTASTQNPSKPPSQPSAPAQAGTASCRCTVCKRNYSSQLMLKRHIRIVHKTYNMKSDRIAARQTATPANPTSTSVSASENAEVKEEQVERSDEEEEEDSESSPAPSPGDSAGTAKACLTNAPKEEEEEEEEEQPASPKVAAPLPPPPSASRADNGATGNLAAKISKLSVGFDLEQLFCKLCKRQFSSRQNLTKHIELHTDGNDIFIKFYRCPLCRYESRRKRDVLRHVTVVHKKSSTYLAKIMPKLESRAVKRLAEVVLSSSTKRTSSNGKEEVNGRPLSSSAPSSPATPRKQESSTPASATSSASSLAPVTRKQQELSSSASAAASPPITRKQERQQNRSVSPPLTRRSEKHSHQRNAASTTLISSQAPNTRRHESGSDSRASSTEVKVTKNFSLHACDQCGRAFAKKLYLESHKRSHRNAAVAAASRRKGVSTRSKSLMW
uniref:Zinc finger protein 800 n=1 Tax=Oryzias sinensis TaxID=183150 RepID=A0A8C8E072_9TELE